MIFIIIRRMGYDRSIGICLQSAYLHISDTTVSPSPTGGQAVTKIADRIAAQQTDYLVISASGVT